MASLTQFYDAVWTVGNQDRSFAEWHNGEPYYYFWACMVDQHDWWVNVEAAAEWLSPYLVENYQRQPHVTILPAGFPPTSALTTSSIATIARELQGFELGLGDLGSFTSAACFEVLDEQDNLVRLRGKLRDVMVDPRSMVTDGDYQPHLTVGLYREQYSTAEICSRIERYTMSPSIRLDVRSFMLARYATTTIKGPIETVAEFALGSGKVIKHCPNQLLP